MGHGCCNYLFLQKYLQWCKFPLSYKLKDECCGFFTDLGVTLWIWNHGVPSIDELLRHFYALWMESAERWQKIGEDIYVVYLATNGKRLDHMF
jgi:hypothetical protein